MSTMTTPLDLPNKGWVCEEIADRGEANFRCEWCNQAIVRYVHKLVNESWFEFIRTGSCCAGQLTDDVIGARVRERAFKLARARRQRWLNADWKHAADGRAYLNASGVNLSTFPIGDGRYGACVSRESGDWKRWAGKTFASEALAKQAALAMVIESKPSKEELKWAAKPSKAKAKSPKPARKDAQLQLALPK